jgi:hypothetical protein
MILIPDANELRELEKFPEKEEASLMNNCPSHMKDEIPSILTKVRNNVISLAPRTTHIFQMLDLS